MTDNYEKALQFLEVHKDGSVYRKERTWVNGNGGVQYQPRQLAKTHIQRNGYVQTDVQIEGKRFYLTVHRLVALVYLPKPAEWNESYEVNHINGVKTDNRLLSWKRTL